MVGFDEERSLGHSEERAAWEKAAMNLSENEGLAQKSVSDPNPNAEAPLR